MQPEPTTSIYRQYVVRDNETAAEVIERETGQQPPNDAILWQLSCFEVPSTSLSRYDGNPFVPRPWCFTGDRHMHVQYFASLDDLPPHLRKIHDEQLAHNKELERKRRTCPVCLIPTGICRHYNDTEPPVGPARRPRQGFRAWLRSLFN